jgi:hypothetical protein
MVRLIPPSRSEGLAWQHASVENFSRRSKDPERAATISQRQIAGSVKKKQCHDGKSPLVESVCHNSPPGKRTNPKQEPPKTKEEDDETPLQPDLPNSPFSLLLWARRKSETKSDSTIRIRRIEDPHHPRGYRELRSNAEMRKLLDKKIVAQKGRCPLCNVEESVVC